MPDAIPDWTIIRVPSVREGMRSMEFLKRVVGKMGTLRSLRKLREVNVIFKKNFRIENLTILFSDS